MLLFISFYFHHSFLCHPPLLSFFLPFSITNISQSSLTFSELIIYLLVDIHSLLYFQDSVVAIPLEKWNIDYVIPQLLCTTENNRCSPTTFPFPKKSIRVDGLARPGDPLPQNAIDPRSLLYVPSGVSTLCCALNFDWNIATNL